MSISKLTADVLNAREGGSRAALNEHFAQLPLGELSLVEYIWLDRDGLFRSKTQTLPKAPERVEGENAPFLEQFENTQF